MKRLNSTLISLWPCDPIWNTSFICCPCTLGLSLLCPHICVSEAEKSGTRLLEQLSLKAKYYDRNISFSLEKRFLTSFVLITFPVKLTEKDLVHNLEITNMVVSEEIIYSNVGNREKHHWKISQFNRFLLKILVRESCWIISYLI